MASAVRFVHCSGFLFDSPFWDGPVSWVNTRNQDLWKTLEAVLALCKSEKVDFLCITGDLFDQEYVRKETVERVAKAFSKLDGTKVFITPGERDPLVLTSAYRFTEWPDNVHIFPGGISQVKIPELGISIYGAGWTNYRQNDNFFEDFPAADDEAELRLMLLHGEVDALHNTDGFVPLQEEQIAESGLTYLALGHREKWSGLQQAGDTFWADCGVVEARCFRNSGPHGVLLGEFEGTALSLELLELSQRRYRQKPIITQTHSIESIAAQLSAETGLQERRKDLFRFLLPESFPEADQASQRLQELLAEQFAFIEVLPYKENAISHSRLDSSDWAARNILGDIPGMAQLFGREIQKRLAEASDDQGRRHWELVKKIGLAALIRHRHDLSSPSRPATEEIIRWPVSQPDDFYRRLRNLQQVGDEDISFEKARDSLSRAHKRVEDQEEMIKEVKTEYEVLKRDWETASRRQEEQRLMRIEIKRLRTKKDHICEKISSVTRIQERLKRLRENPDYYELRRMERELSRLEELYRNAEIELSAYTRNTKVDQLMLEELREECLEWAAQQERLEQFTVEVEQRQALIGEIENRLRRSGYSELPENEDHRLLQLQKDREKALEEMVQLENLHAQILILEEKYRLENDKLEDFAALAEITEADERKMERLIRRLAKRRNSKLTGIFNQMLEKQFGWAGIDERLHSKLMHFFQRFEVADYAEFKRRQQEYQNRLNAAANLKSQLDNLRKQARRGKELRRLIHAREKMLEHAFERVQASDYTAWMTGWETYHQNKRRQVELQQELQFHHEQLRSQEEKVQLSADQLREKLQNWGSSVSNVDEVLGIIMMVARRLRTKEEAEKEFNSLKLSYLTQLGQRNMDQLSKELEPIEDLESEEVLPDEKRKEGMQACQKELAAVESELKTAERSLQHTRLTTSITDLEIKLETARQKWQAHEDLRRALDDTENLLETSWQKWLTDYGNMLEAEARLINGRTFAAADSEDRNGRDDMKRQYFAYRMVLLLQALGDRPDAPIVFSVDVMKESQTFWKDILTYFLKLSRVRPVVFVTADSKLHKLASHLADQERIENESGEEKNGFTLKKADGFAPS